MKTSFTHRHIAAALLAAILTLPFALQLMAVLTPPTPKPPVEPPGFNIDDPIREGLIKDILTITNRAYSKEIGTESAINAVQTSAAVTVETNSQIRFESGGQITLKPGFRAKEGSYFQARIGFTSHALATPTETKGVPIGLILDSNNNGVPDLIELRLGLDPTKDNSSNPQIQNFQQSKREYGYDKNNQLISEPARTYNLDAEGNVLNSN